MAAAELQEMPVKRSFPRDVSGRDIQSCQDSHHNDELTSPVEDMKGTRFFISRLQKPRFLIYVLLVVTTKHAMLRSTFITRKDSIR